MRNSAEKYPGKLFHAELSPIVINSSARNSGTIGVLKMKCELDV
jgi:hypothetical protein